MKTTSKRDLIVPFLGLFTSLGTLLCCGLPALFVALGAGAALAGLVTAVPQLVWLSAHKGLVFGTAGVLIVFSAIMWWRSRYAPCPADPKAAKICMRMRALNGYVVLGAAVVYAVGSFFAFVAPRLF